MCVPIERDEDFGAAGPLSEEISTMPQATRGEMATDSPARDHNGRALYPSCARARASPHPRPSRKLRLQDTFVTSVIAGHGMWKYRLHNAIETGHSDASPEKVAA